MSLPVIVAVYGRVVLPQDAAGARPPDRILDDADLEILRAEMETYRLWAWRQSSLKLNLDFHWILVEEPRDHVQFADII